MSTALRSARNRAFTGNIKRFGSARFLACSAAVCLFSGVAQAELLTNGSFNIDADTSGGPDGWVGWNYGPTAFSAYKADPANDLFDFDGSPYVNAGNYGEWWTSGGGWYQEVPVTTTAGTPFSLSAFCATEDWDNAAGELRLIYLGEGNVELQRDVRHSAEYQSNQPWTLTELTSIAPAGTVVVKVELATWGARGAVLWDQSSLNTANIWNVDSEGVASDAGNWIGGVPNGVDAAARFLGKITAGRTVAVDAPLTLGSISFDNANSYVLAGTSTLRLETTSGLAMVHVQAGTHRINVPTMIASDAYLSVATGATLEIADAFTVAAGKSVRPSGAGTISYQSSVTLEDNASIVFAGNAQLTSLNLAAGAKVMLPAHGSSSAKTLTVNALNAASGATVDVTDNVLVVNYSGASPADSIRGLIGSAFNAGAWNGVGLTSSVITPGRGLGYADSGSAVTVKLALLGDASLNGIVDFDDLLLLAQNYGVSTNAGWGMGDFNYNAGVEFDDLLALAQNYGSSLSVVDTSAFSPDFAADLALAMSIVPEPTSLGTAAFLISLSRRRRP